MDVFTFDNVSYVSPLPSIPQLRWEKGTAPRFNAILPKSMRYVPPENLLTALSLIAALSKTYPAVRFIFQEPRGDAEDMFDFNAYVKQLPQKTLQTASYSDETPLDVTSSDVFFCMDWTSVLLWQAHAALMTKHGRPRTPFYYFIQDFEPGSVPFSSTYGQILATYNHKHYTHAIINSLELGAFFRRQGFSFAKTYTLKPSLNAAIASWLRSVDFMLPAKPKSPLMLVVYSRPQILQNAFDAAMAGCKRFVDGLSRKERQNLRIVSVGDHHQHIDLHGMEVRSLGWLDVEAYINLLSSAHMGLSLKVSPHPSYPPLEMATMGLHTVTNAFYPGKDLTGNHPLLLSVSAPDPELIAASLAEAHALTRSQPTGATPVILPASLSIHSREEDIDKLRIAPIIPK
ncbi:hypothetical protein [Desulfovibrio inopinatus]|uniref:rhamnosyltransferase WsaF family glycosyltransferase n=1 Tax=Desulfovibrio inopinatus TaxID=102109 RepID=UPI0004023885|nr:hypothetical protein [Desulfovibrio inopinatus]